MKPIAIALGILLLFAVGLLSTFFYAVVLHDLWAWFVAPALLLPPLSWRQCVGLLYAAGFFVLWAVTSFKRDERSTRERVIDGFSLMIGKSFGLAILWGGAAILHAVLV